MKKQLRSLVALALVLILALVAYLLLRGGGEAEGAAAPDPSVSGTEALYAMGGVPQLHARSVTLHNEHGSFTIENVHATAEAEVAAGENAYTIEGIDTAYLNVNLIKNIFTNVGSMEAKQRIAGTYADLSLYGLREPRATVEAVYEDGSSATLTIGDSAPGGEGTYVQSGGTVYLVYTSSLTNLYYPRLGLVDKAITGGGTQTTTIRTATLTGGEYGDSPLVIRRSVDDDELGQLLGSSTYAITSPIQAAADLNAVSSLSSVFALTASEVVAEADSDNTLASYGLLEPRLTVAVEPVQPEDEESEAVAPFTLHISETDAEGYVYLRRDEGPYLYRLEADVLTFLGLTLFDYRDKAVLQPDINTVAELVVETPDDTYTFTLEDIPVEEGDEGETTLRVTLDGREIDTANFRGFYRTVISASYEGVLADSGDEDAGDDPADIAEPGDADLLLRYTFRYREGGGNTVTFYTGEARRPYVRLDDGEWFHATSRYVDRVTGDAAKLAVGESVSAYSG